MEIAQYLRDAAEKVLRFEGNANLPQKLEGTNFYLAKADDSSVTAFGVIKYGDAEYKIGTKKEQ